MNAGFRAHKLLFPSEPHHAGLPRARGAIDRFGQVETSLRIFGWILHPLRPLEQASVYVNGDLLGTCPLSLRPDVAQAFPAIPHAGLSGFDVSAQNRDDSGEIVKITVVGSHNGDEETAFHSCHSR